MTIMEMEIRNKLLADINSEVLSIKSESVIGVLTEMLTKLKKIPNNKHRESWLDDLGDGWIDDRSTDEIIKDIKELRTANKEVDL